jgi:hypothetical protein
MLETPSAICWTPHESTNARECAAEAYDWHTNLSRKTNLYGVLEQMSLTEQINVPVANSRLLGLIFPDDARRFRIVIQVVTSSWAARRRILTSLSNLAVTQAIDETQAS